MSIIDLRRRRPLALTTRLARDRRGVSVIEFAFVAGPLVALMLAILQISLVFFTQQNLESVTAKAARKLMTGSARSSGMTQAQFTAYVCQQLPVFMKCPNIMIDVQTTTDFSSASTAAPTLTYDANGNVNNGWAYSPGGTGQITTLKVMYIWQTTKGPLRFDLSNMSSANRLLIATVVVLPTGLIVANTSLIYSEISYQYIPSIASTMIGQIPLKDTLYMSPRNSASIPCSDCT